MEQEPLGLIAAKSCPHYITLRFVQETGQDEKCAGCQFRPLTKFGQYGKSGPTSRRRTTVSDPAGTQWMKRQQVA